ncbi:medium-chain specific acyl-CoA dehydrogenase [Rhizoctonia solani AG-1 IA]|uniref:Medium-chain specific acyl-CoA dehydrogenase n=1 Tax=Thanatephorus cucumeris (strain AG1-IA) TaxID=983506 RepID=L8WEC8_THACA|nr:medium-chain specific acyl-CoA dehydrogenase [Rhizoctonia solani AG-1 IA]
MTIRGHYESVAQQPSGSIFGKCGASRKKYEAYIEYTVPSISRFTSGLEEWVDNWTIMSMSGAGPSQPANIENSSGIMLIDPHNPHAPPEEPHNITEQEVGEYREQDRYLPVRIHQAPLRILPLSTPWSVQIANVARIMKAAIPENAKIAKDAKECLQECVSELISFITSEAAEKCFMEKRKTIGGEDILYAMTSLGFDDYEATLKIYLAKLRQPLLLKAFIPRMKTITHTMTKSSTAILPNLTLALKSTRQVEQPPLRPAMNTSRAFPKVLRPLSLAQCRRMATQTPGPSGVGFGLSEEQAGIQGNLHERTLCLSQPSTIDPWSVPRGHVHSQARSQYGASQQYPWPIIKKAHGVGLLNTHIPEEYGGPGLGLVECALISEGGPAVEIVIVFSFINYPELAYGCTGIQTAIEANGLAQAPLIVAASEEIKKKYLGRMTEAPLVAAYGVVSVCPNLPTVRSHGIVLDRARGRFRCRQYQHQSSQKRGQVDLERNEDVVITNAGHANWFFVLARTDSSQPASRGMTGFVVDADSPGISLGKKEINMGQGGGLTCSDRQVTWVELLPSQNVIGAPGEGFKIAMSKYLKNKGQTEYHQLADAVLRGL